MDDDRDELVLTEIEDEQIRVALASRLSLQESGAEGDLEQIYDSNDESSPKRSQLVSASTEKPVTGHIQKRKSSQELDDDRIKAILEIQGG